MNKLNKVYNLTIKDYLSIYENLGFKSEIITQGNTECILLSDSDNIPLYIVYINTFNKKLNYDDVKNILIELELEFQSYNCRNYILISEEGYLNNSAFLKDENINIFDIENLNIKLESVEYIEQLIKHSSSKQKYFELNAHNKVAYNNIKQKFEEGENKVYVRHATGTGKSILTSKYILDECEGNIVLLSSSKSILEQFSEHLDTYQAGKIYMLTYNKLAFMSNNEPDFFKSINPSLIVLDEFHRCGAKVWSKGVDKLLASYPNTKVLGTSATPIRYLDDTRDMGDEIFNGNIANKLDLCEAIVRGILPSPTYIIAMYEFEEALNDLKNKVIKCNDSVIEKAKTLKKIEALSDLNQTSGLIKNAFNKHIDNKRNFVVFCKDLEHINTAKKIVSTWFNNFMEDNNLSCNINTYTLHFTNSDNKSVVDSYKNAIKNNSNNDFNLLFAVDMANEGIHSKYIDGAILLRPTKSPIVYYQQIGRALHVNPMNTPIIFDFVNNSEYIQSQNFITGIKKAYENVNNSTNSLLSELKDIDIFLNNIHDESRDFVDVLNEINDKTRVEWDLMFKELVRFKNIKGTTIVRESDDEKLYKWVLKQRKLYKSGDLKPERKELLDEIGFVTYPKDVAWIEQYEALKSYKSIHGHINVLKKENPKLYSFIKTQRRFYDEGKLSKERISLLESLGMVWDVLEHRWELNFLELVKVYDKLGTLYPVENDPIVTYNGVTVIIDEDLMQWIKNTRKYYTKGTLSEDKISRLESLGLALNLPKKYWDDNMAVVKKFFNENGHCNLSEQYDKRVYVWLTRLRSSYCNGTLNSEVIEELESMGMVWSKRDLLWEERFAQFIKYFKEYNTPLMEKGYPGFDKELDTWIKTQRKKYSSGDLLEERFNRLNLAGFAWNTNEYKWFSYYNELKDFLLSIGETAYNVSLLKAYKGDKNINAWINTQRAAFRKHKLSEDKYKLLLELGVDFN